MTSAKQWKKRFSQDCANPLFWTRSPAASYFLRNTSQFFWLQLLGIGLSYDKYFWSTSDASMNKINHVRDVRINADNCLWRRFLQSISSERPNPKVQLRFWRLCFETTVICISCGKLVKKLHCSRNCWWLAPNVVETQAAKPAGTSTGCLAESAARPSYQQQICCHQTSTASCFLACQQQRRATSTMHVCTNKQFWILCSWDSWIVHDWMSFLWEENQID